MSVEQMSNVTPFVDPFAPLRGKERLAARKAYKAACAYVASQAVANAFTQSYQLIRVTRKLGCDDALPIFVAAMRRELRKSGLF